MRRSYDAIWVYGDPRVYDLVRRVRPARRRRAGWSATPATSTAAPPSARPPDLAARRRELRLPDGRIALCVLGGGEDGHALAAAFARADAPGGHDRRRRRRAVHAGRRARGLHALAAGRDDLRVLDFVPDAEALIALADDVVAMGGYNTVCEILASAHARARRPARAPRHEQVIRARRLGALGARRHARAGRARAGRDSAWLAAGGAGRPAPAAEVDMRGLARLPGLLDELVAGDGDTGAPRLADPPRFLRIPARRPARTGSVSA